MLRQSGILRLAEIAAKLGGVVEGNADTLITGIATLDQAKRGDLSFLSHPKYKAQLRETTASAVIISSALGDLTVIPRILCEDPYLYLARAVDLLYPETEGTPGIHPSAVVSESATVAPTASIGPHCLVAAGAIIGDRTQLGACCNVGEETIIGKDSRLHPQVVLYSGVKIGARARIHSGAVIGSDGFGMARSAEGWRKIPQIGGVIVGDDVEIGASTTIDRGALSDTVIGNGVKLDNQIQIGHNVKIGDHTAIAGCVGIAGSARIGRWCTIGGGAVVLGHLEVCDDVHIGAGTVVMKSVTAPGHYAGLYPMQSRETWARNAARVRHLEELNDRVKALEELVRRIEHKE